VAAAISYGLGAENKNGYWLVFDFGGGTFDVALLRSEEGILSVKDSDGDNWLGGKNLDEAIVDRIILPNLQENYAIDNILHDPEKRELLRNAVKQYAEDAKIALSFKDTHNILSQLGDLPFEDENGDEPEVDVLVEQKDLEMVLSPIFQKAIDITHGLLHRNNLKGADLGGIILVGGTTHSPVLRKMIREQISEKIDTSEDPMTVVAKGAALFASTIPISEELIKENEKTIVQLDVKYDSFTVETEELVNVKLLKDRQYAIQFHVRCRFGQYEQKTAVVKFCQSQRLKMKRETPAEIGINTVLFPNRRTRIYIEILVRNIFNIKHFRRITPHRLGGSEKVARPAQHRQNDNNNCNSFEGFHVLLYLITNYEQIFIFHSLFFTPTNCPIS